MNTRIHVHTYIYTYVFIKKKKKTIFFCISNLTTKRRIEISPSVIQLRTAWFNLKQIYVRTWKGSTFEGNERRRLAISKERKISYKFEKILFRMKKKKKKRIKHVFIAEFRRNILTLMFFCGNEKEGRGKWSERTDFRRNVKYVKFYYIDKIEFAHGIYWPYNRSFIRWNKNSFIN